MKIPHEFLANWTIIQVKCMFKVAHFFRIVPFQVDPSIGTGARMKLKKTGKLFYYIMHLILNIVSIVQLQSFVYYVNAHGLDLLSISHSLLLCCHMAAVSFSMGNLSQSDNAVLIVNTTNELCESSGVYWTEDFFVQLFTNSMSQGAVFLVGLFAIGFPLVFSGVPWVLIVISEGWYVVFSVILETAMLTMLAATILANMLVMLIGLTTIKQCLKRLR